MATLLAAREQGAAAARVPAGDRSAPLASPVFAALAGLPPLLIQVGSHEVLLDDAIRLAANAGRDDVEVRLQVAPEGTHVFQFQFGALDEADEAITRSRGSSSGTLASRRRAASATNRTARRVNRWHGLLAVEMIEDRES